MVEGFHESPCRLQIISYFFCLDVWNGQIYNISGLISYFAKGQSFSVQRVINYDISPSLLEQAFDQQHDFILL
jgi:hypothetical protein